MMFTFVVCELEMCAELTLIWDAQHISTQVLLTGDLF